MQNITLRFAQFSIVGDLLPIPTDLVGSHYAPTKFGTPTDGLPHDLSLNEWVHEQSQALSHRERLPLPVRHGSFQVCPP
jgi:hypothetical protein